MRVTATGQDIKVYGKKTIPFIFGKFKFKIEFIITDVETPLISGGDLIKNKIQLKIGEKSYLKYEKKRYKLINKDMLTYLHIKEDKNEAVFLNKYNKKSISTVKDLKIQQTKKKKRIKRKVKLKATTNNKETQKKKGEV
jgi:hypothetical protein